MKNVLLLIHEDPGQEARLQAAVDAVRALDGSLTCLDVTETPGRDLGGYVSLVTAMMLEQATLTEQYNKATVLPRLAAKGIEPDWIDVTADLADAMTEHGRLADLIVINTMLPDGGSPDMAALARGLVRRIRAPILAVPPRVTEFRAHGSAVVFWDGSTDAEAALSAAIPLLKLASQVTVLQIDTGHSTLPARDAIDYLRKQGIPAHTSVREAAGPPAPMLEHYLHRHGQAYAVMGAFGHGRLHDTLLGSATRHLFATSPVPLLIARHT